MTPPRYVTVRNLPHDVARALRAEARRRGTSLNETVTDLLRRALGLGPDARFDNGLGELAGTWDAARLAEFEQATACFEEIDEELWK